MSWHGYAMEVDAKKERGRTLFWHGRELDPGQYFI